MTTAADISGRPPIFKPRQDPPPVWGKTIEEMCQGVSAKVRPKRTFAYAPHFDLLDGDGETRPGLKR